MVWAIFSQKTDENDLQRHAHLPYPSCIFNTSLTNGQSAPLGNYMYLKNILMYSLLCKQDCPGNWTKFGCKCYFISNEMESWNKSRELCGSVGADLVVVDSEEEMDFINIEGKSYWFGATDEASEGLWRWVDGTVLSADNPYWFSGHRDGGKDMNCLMRVWEENTHKWTDESCEESNYALCEYSIIQ
uniref:C-type lectin domain-containing protein n=1 Tax=Gadus morhua TaxID=8049 RepID=A0A8C4ZUS7_GADMO